MKTKLQKLGLVVVLMLGMFGVTNAQTINYNDSIYATKVMHGDTVFLKIDYTWDKSVQSFLGDGETGDRRNLFLYLCKIK